LRFASPKRRPRIFFAIWLHIAGQSGPERADALEARLQAACLRLEYFPERGTPRDEWEAGLRSIPFERRATICYRLIGQTAEIVRVLYAGKDAGRAFGAEAE
jgi:toxin ParE1/3/4